MGETYHSQWYISTYSLTFTFSDNKTLSLQLTSVLSVICYVAVFWPELWLQCQSDHCLWGCSGVCRHEQIHNSPQIPCFCCHVRPVARIFARGVTWVSDVYVCMYNHAKLEGCGDMLPQEIFRELDALRLFLWDRSRAVVAVYATWLVEYCIQFLAAHVCYC